jgi:carbon-monoxide dehydrogenase iron sulfur subunit
MQPTTNTLKKKVLAKADLCVGCELCMAACSITHFGENNPRLSGILIRRDLFQRYEIQFICRHCDDPKCVDACIMGNITKDPVTGVVTHSLEDCVGCWSCLMACPFDALNRAVVNGRPVVIRCDLCPDRDIPACVVVCPTEALVLVQQPPD